LMNVVNEEWEDDEYALGLAPSGGLSIPGGGRRRRQQDGWREAKQKRDSWLPPLLPLEPIVVPHKGVNAHAGWLIRERLSVLELINSPQPRWAPPERKVLRSKLPKRLEQLATPLRPRDPWRTVTADGRPFVRSVSTPAGLVRTVEARAPSRPSRLSPLPARHEATPFPQSIYSQASLPTLPTALPTATTHEKRRFG